MLSICCGVHTLALAQLSAQPSAHSHEYPPSPTHRTLDLRSTSSTMDFRSTACAKCHADIFAQWTSSAHHHSSFNQPYYSTAALDFIDKRGVEDFEFCGRCHDPLLISSPAYLEHREVNIESAEAQAGITCLICHSMHHKPKVTGNGRYTLSSAPWRSRSTDHTKRLAHPRLKSSYLCGSCHRSSISKELNGSHWQMGQDDLLRWSQSGYAGQDIKHIFSSDHETRTCQECHMPLERVTQGDKAAHEGMVRSHRFLGANATLATFRGDVEHLEKTRNFLAGSVEMWVEKVSWTPMKKTIDVVLYTDRIGHRFPAGVNDTNEAWIEISAFDDRAHVIVERGVIGADLKRRDGHLIRIQPVDQHAQPLQERDVTRQHARLFDTSLHPHAPRVIRYHLPPQTSALTLRLLYRQMNHEYAQYACEAKDERCLRQPIIEVSKARYPEEPLYDASMFSVKLGLINRAGDVQEERDGCRSLRRLNNDFNDQRCAQPLRGDRLKQKLIYLSGLSQGVSRDVKRADDEMQSLTQELSERGREPSVHIVLVQATLARALGRTDLVLKKIRQLERPPYSLKPHEYVVRYWIAAQALTKAFRHKSALPFAEHLSKHRPRNLEALIMLTRLRALNDHQDTLLLSKRIIELNPESAEGWRLYALSLRHHGGEPKEISDAEDRWFQLRRPKEIELEMRAIFRDSAPDQRPLLMALPTYNLTKD